MCLSIEGPMSKKVKRIQSTFDVGDFKHPDKEVKVKSEGKLLQIKLVGGENPLVDKKVESDDIYIDENGVLSLCYTSLFSLQILEMLPNMIQI